MENLRINGDRLWDSLMEMAKIGATEKGGVCRLALTDLDRESRDLFVKWCKDAGCTVEVDAIGNIFARRPGRNNDLPAIMTGSHLDSQPTGGKFDGAYGVLAGLEVIRSLNDAGYETEHPVEIVAWTNEEGSRFAPAMLGSGAYTGALDPDWCLARTDLEGKSVAEELKRIGYAGEAPLGGRPVAACFEAHIEQGPVLEAEGKPIGVVTGGQGQRWYELTFTGQEAHAGPTPMARRKDALVGAAEAVQLVNQIGFDFQPDACATCGMMQVSPNSRNVIPGKVWVTIDMRHPVDARLSGMDEALRTGVEEIAKRRNLEVQLDAIWHFPATPFDPDCVSAVRDGASALGYEHRDIVSGAGHDAINMSGVAPTGMIFVPCEDGISHNEIENATPEDLTAGCNVLLQAMLRSDRKQAE
ncbi:MAG: Zn-dependent hydrolase [Pseudomonadota bacterium]